MNTFTLGGRKLKLLFLTVVGSTLHQLNLNNSDLDLKGVFVWDLDTSFSMNDNQVNLSKKNVLKDDWTKFTQDLNTSFNLNLKDNDSTHSGHKLSEMDLELFEVKEFFKLSLKNDSNMLDMLFSNLKHVHVEDSFNNVLKNRDLFLNLEFAKSRFLGMSSNCLKNAEKNNLLVKDMAKSLQMLHSLLFFLQNNTFSPVLNNDDREEVLKVKNGDVPFEEVKLRYNELDLMVQDKLKNLVFKTKNLDNVNSMFTLLMKTELKKMLKD